MEKRLRLAVYIDYALRTPSFFETYNNLKSYLFSEKAAMLEEELEGDMMLRNFWAEEIKNSDIENFYIKTIPPEDNIKNKDWKKYFFNETHYLKFLEDYSYNLYVTAEVPNKKDIELINIVQRYLFDVVLVDEYLDSRKKSNTFFYLSKNRFTPREVLFLKEGEQIEATEYLAVWNPKADSTQENGIGLSDFEMWLKELESQNKPNPEKND